MKINIPKNCVIINGTCYEAVHIEDPDCDGCIFFEKYECECDGMCQKVFNDISVKFIKTDIVIND